MVIDCRKLLKDVVRGTICDFDIPAAPIALDERGEGIECSREELELFFQLVDELTVELDVRRPFVLREITKLRQDYLGPGGLASTDDRCSP